MFFKKIKREHELVKAFHKLFLTPNGKLKPEAEIVIEFLRDEAGARGELGAGGVPYFYDAQNRFDPNAAAFLLGTHDFSFFRSSGSVQSSPVKTIYKALWTEKAPGDLLFVIEGDGFLYRMVRNIVWNLAEAGLGRKSLEQFKEELDKAERHFKISPAPPQGLYLDYVGYTEYLP